LTLAFLISPMKRPEGYSHYIKFEGV